MRRILPTVIAVALIAAACSSDSTPDSATSATTSVATTTTAATTTSIATTSTAEATTTTEPASSSSPLVIQSLDFGAGTIEIRNAGSSEYDLSGHWVCNRPAYVELPAQSLAPGESITLPMDGLGITPEGGEIGLYTTNSFGSAEAIARYVEWGSAGHGRSGTAIAAGLWAEDDFVDNGGANIASAGDDPVSSADWSTTG